LDGTWIATFTAIGFGAIMAAVVTYAGNRWMKKREEYIDLSKYKIDTITKQKHYLFQLKRYYWLLGLIINDEILERGYRSEDTSQPVRVLNPAEGNETRSDYDIWMYYLCCILTIQRKIFEQYGGIQLDDKKAENVLAEFMREFARYVMDPFDTTQADRLSYLIRTEPDYSSISEFRILIQDPDNNPLYADFERAFRNMKLDRLKKIQHNSQAASLLLGLEVNQVYELWYKSGTNKIFENFANFDELASPELKEYLTKRHPLYFSRIREFDLKRDDKISRAIFRLRNG
jgi:hypothetical protein